MIQIDTIGFVDIEYHCVHLLYKIDMKNIYYLLTAFIFFCSCSVNNADVSLKTVEKTLKIAQQHTLLMAKALEELPGRLPKTIGPDGQLETSNEYWWTSGFFPGQLWYMYEFSGDENMKNKAELFLKRIENQQYVTDSHDVGFIIFCSFGNAYRITQNEVYLPVIENAAKSLSTRFSPLTQTICSWNRASWNNQWQYAVIIDNMMNLELLEWSAHKFNEPRFAEIAQSHTNTTMANHFRLDGSSFHVVSYDTITGLPELYHTSQGYSHESAWARGQAWGLYGYTLMYRYNNNGKYLDQAQKIADFLINHPRLPTDKIPYWDFDAPDIPIALRDASAGAIMCSALLELHQYVQPQKGREYLDVAKKQLASLCSDTYLAKVGTNHNFILKHGVGHMPNGTEVDVPLSYADYYFVEALMRYREQFGE